MPAAKQVGATWDDGQWDAGSPSTVVARKPTIMRMLILWAVVFGSVVCDGATGVCGEAELLPERPEGAVEGDADIGAYPRPDAGYVTDLADMLSRDEEERIEQLLWRAESEKGVEIAVVTIDSLKEHPGTANDSIESFATELFNRYRIGNLPKNDGVLLLVSKRDHKMRIELGKGWERGHDADAAQIITRDIRPQFKAERYGAGIEAGVKAIVATFAGLEAAGGATDFPWMILAIVAAGVVVAAFVVSLFRSGRSGWGWLTMALFGAGLFALFQALEQYGRRAQGSSGDSGNWSSGGSGGDFGGGSSDGGGASGDW